MFKKQRAIFNREQYINGILLFFFLLFVNHFGYTQNGKLLSKKQIDISQTPHWELFSENDTLTSAFQYLDQLDFYFITYQSDGLIVKGITVEPKDPGKYPVVIFNRGGNRDFSPLSTAMMIMYTSKLAVNGFVILGSNYRVEDEFGGREINDVLCLTETIKEIEKADSNKIGMFGWSRGGMMTYLALQKSDKIKTAIVGNGPTDLFETISDRPIIESNVLVECVPNYFENKDFELKKRSVIFWPEELNKNTSLLILCATNDDRVNPEQAHKLAKKLNDLNYNYLIVEMETDHFYSDKKNELNDLLINWFTKELKDYH